MQQSIPSQDETVVIVKCEAYTLYDRWKEVITDEHNVTNDNEHIVKEYMKCKSADDYFNVKAIMIPIYENSHYSLVVVINPNGILVCYTLYYFCVLFNTVYAYT